MNDPKASIICHAPNKQLKLGELRRALAAIPARYDDVLVETEGCDCVGPCSGFELDETGLLFNRGQ